MPREEQTEPGQLNLDAQLPPQSISVQPPETPEDANHRRWRNRVITIFAILLASAFSIAALVAFFLGDPEQREWGASALTLALGGLIGFLTGKNTA